MNRKQTRKRKASRLPKTSKAPTQNKQANEKRIEEISNDNASLWILLLQKWCGTWAAVLESRTGQHRESSTSETIFDESQAVARKKYKDKNQPERK